MGQGLEAVIINQDAAYPIKTYEDPKWHIPCRLNKALYSESSTPS